MHGGCRRLRISDGKSERDGHQGAVYGGRVLETFHFQSPYAMRPHGDEENGLNWDDGHTAYNQLSILLSEAVAGFAHIYGYGE